ncbi:transporter [Sphingomonas sp.]|uniref:transporter n=1 Tax=Sphingomonas sp. TaxID=28214 RepID=UPI003B002732
MRIWPVAAALVSFGSAAHAAREFCPDRPGESTPACTLDPGTLQVEAGLIDYAHTRTSDEVEDQTLVGDSLVRYGVADHAELRLGWTAYGVDRTRDRVDGSVDHRHGVGDVTLGLRRNLYDPDGSGLSIAVQPFATLPTGHMPIGAGTWSAGILTPIVAELDDKWSLTVDPELDAAADEDEHGRHLAYSGVLDLQRKLTDDLSLVAEGFVQRDDDPQAHQTLASANLLAAYQVGKDSQVDVSLYKGLNRQTPRVELILGVVHRFR